LTVHTFTCIKCPLGCQIELTEEGGTIKTIEGHTCPQGELYVKEEFSHPVRMVTTTIVVIDGVLPRLPVRSERPVPRSLVKECVSKLSGVQVKAPVRCGDIIYENILDTGVHILASRNLEKKEE
jgi:CxxC motif-containing protein